MKEREAEGVLWGRVAKADSEKKKLLNLSEISLILDTYDDIFSDFDPRAYMERAVSDDFLLELKKASKDKPSGGIEIKFLIPEKERNASHENIIRRRLREYFTRHHQLLEREVRNLKIRAAVQTAAGMLMIMVATYLSGLDASLLWARLLMVILEPAGWFTAWTGLEHYGFSRREKDTELNFYHKMMQAEIIFLPY